MFIVASPQHHGPSLETRIEQFRSGGDENNSGFRVQGDLANQETRVAGFFHIYIYVYIYICIYTYIWFYF